MSIIENRFMELTIGFDPAAFWAENETCQGFTTHKPRCAAVIDPDDHWLFEFLDIPSTFCYDLDKAYRDDLLHQANALIKEYVDKTFFDEDTWDHSPRRIENLFGCEFSYRERGTPWFLAVTNDPGEFCRILDRAAHTDLKNRVFSEDFLSEGEQRRASGQEMPRLGTGSRGPTMIMTSVLDIETAFFWFFDYPDFMARFRDLLTEKLVELNILLRDFSSNTEIGWWIPDDNRALFNRKLDVEYCLPVLEKVLDAIAPGHAPRYQHSDSAMGHLLDVQYALGIRKVNHGPQVDVALIREKMPKAMIEGRIPPFLLRKGSPKEIRDRIHDDFQKAGQIGGLKVTTAGSLPAGTGVGRMRWMMQVVQDFAVMTNRLHLFKNMEQGGVTGLRTTSAKPHLL